MNDQEPQGRKAAYILILGAVYATCVAIASNVAPDGVALLLALVGWAILIGMWICERSPWRKAERARQLRLRASRLHFGL